MGECRIGINLAGKFKICEISTHSNIQVSKGEVILFEPNKEYEINGNGQLCIGWSTF